MLALFVLAGCSVDEGEPIAAVGRWVSDQSSFYYFELYDDGNCIMFDCNDNWVSEGTYRADASHIEFDMDTGSFTWSKEEDGMVFETADGKVTYYLQETDENV